jgi:tRNA-Thr(GGU) m(6)t(6)A37 methyltransferase TsaA
MSLEINALDRNAKKEVHFIGVVERAEEQEARIRIFQEYCAGLKGIEEYSHLIILYWLHLRDSEKERQTLLVFPRRHEVNVEKGVFACRSPSRPNPIALCVVQLLKAENCILTVKGLDALEGSPIVDIKPYLPRADSIPNAEAPPWTDVGPPT